MTGNSRNPQKGRPQRTSPASPGSRRTSPARKPSSVASGKTPSHARSSASVESYSRHASSQGSPYARSSSAVAAGGVDFYRRGNYVPPKQKRSKKKIILAIVIPLVLILVAALGYAVWYMGQLDDALSMDGDKEKAVSDVLVPANLEDPFYMLVLGSDSREGSGTSDKAEESGDNERSDVMILLRVDAKNRQLTMVSIPRDTPITLANGSRAKINEAYNIGGAAYSIEKVSELAGVGISHYAEIHFSEFETVIDKIGGVTVDVPVEMSYKDALTGETVTLQPGTQTLDGQKAQIFVRARKVYDSNQDAKRQDNTRVLMMAIIERVLDKPLHELPNAVLDLATCVGTDFNPDEILALAFSYAGGSGKMTVYSGSGPTDGAVDEATGLWLCYENPERWAKLMDVVDSGEDPRDIDVKSSA